MPDACMMALPPPPPAAGCVIGDTRGARIASSPWNAGAWSGKCFNRWDTTKNLPVGVSNIITPNKDQLVRAWLGARLLLCSGWHACMHAWLCTQCLCVGDAWGSQMEVGSTMHDWVLLHRSVLLPLTARTCCPPRALAPLRITQEWSKGMPGVLAYAADVLVKSSLVDGEPTWIIDYTNSPPFGGRSINYFEDEMREVRGWVGLLP
jgi:hypothetical protein